MTTTLVSEFKGINIDEVIEYFDNKRSFYSALSQEDISTPLLSAPRLFFYDENVIEPGYYDFEYSDMSFRFCWIEPYDKIENGPTRYCSGTYSVIRIFD